MHTKVDCVCPKCKCLNHVKLSTELHCKYCDESLTDKTYTQKSWWLTIPVITLSLAGGGTLGGYAMHSLTHAHHRYPIKDEYLIINSCTSADNTLIEAEDFKRKKNICICALEKTQNKITGRDDLQFLTVFRAEVEECLGEERY